MESIKQEVYWKCYAEDKPVLETRPLDKEYDAVIVGGGIIGLSAARFLLEKDLKIALLDRHELGGSSALSGGIIMDDNEKDFIEWISELGHENASRLLRATRDSANELAEFIRQNKIELPEKNGALVAARTKGDLKTLNEDIEAHRHFGWSPEVLSQEELNRRVASKVFLGGYFNPHIYTVHSYRMMRNFAKYLQENGCQISENIEVQSIDINKNILKTRNGHIKAKTILVTSDGASQKLIHLKKHALPLTSFLVATEPLEQTALEKIGWQGREVVWDIGRIFSYFRLLPDNRIVFGPGSADVFGDLTQDKKRHLKVARIAEKELSEIFTVPIKVEYVWSGIVHVTEDELPDFGALPQNKSILFAAGASLALGSWVGKQLALTALGQEVKDSPLFQTLQSHHRGPYSLLFHAPLPKSLRMFIANRFLRFLG